MSCYTSLRITENPEFTRLQQRCEQYMEHQRSGLRETFSDCQALEERLGRMGQNLTRQLEHATSVLNTIEHSVSGAHEYLEDMSAQMESLRRTCANIQESSRALLHVSQQSIDIGIKQTECLSDSLSSMNEETLRALEEIAEAPHSLNHCFKIIEARLAELINARSTTNKESKELEQTWQQVISMQNELITTRNEWQAIYSELNGVQQSISSRISALTLVSDSMEMSQATAYALLEALQDRNFNLLAYERTSAGIEAYLEDSQLRKVAFRFTSELDSAQRVLLELNVSDFESEEDSISCELITEEMLDVLSEVGILEETKTDRPHRDNFGRSSVKVRPKRKEKTVGNGRNHKLKESE